MATLPILPCPCAHCAYEQLGSMQSHVHLGMASRVVAIVEIIET
jgi:hypothetical protein